MTEQELLNALKEAQEIEPKIWRIWISLNKTGADVNFYNSTLQGHRIYGSGDGDTLREAVDAALESVRVNS